LIVTGVLNNNIMRLSVFFVTLSSIAVFASAINSHPVPTGQVGLLKNYLKSPLRQDRLYQFRGGQDVSSEEGADDEGIANDDVEAGVEETNQESSALSKKLSNLKERTLPAILMLGVVGGLGYYFEEQGIVGLVLMLQIGMYQEMTTVIGGKLQSFMKWWWFLTAAVGLNGPRLFPAEAKQISAASYSMVIFGIVQKVVRLQATNQDVAGFREFLRQTAVSALSVLFTLLPSSYLLSTLNEFGMIWVIYSAVLMIFNDTMAYFFGITLGKNPLLPVISPKKTWEGFIGAAASTMVLAYYWLPNEDDAIVLSTFVSLIAPFGGFMASVIKRSYEQKDFGSLFPGHGGFVDRLDCQLILAPFVYLYLIFKPTAN